MAGHPAPCGVGSSCSLGGREEGERLGGGASFMQQVYDGGHGRRKRAKEGRKTEWLWPQVKREKYWSRARGGRAGKRRQRGPSVLRVERRQRAEEARPSTHPEQQRHRTAARRWSGLFIAPPPPPRAHGGGPAERLLCALRKKMRPGNSIAGAGVGQKGFTEGSRHVACAKGRWVCTRAGSRSAQREAGRGGGEGGGE